MPQAKQLASQGHSPTHQQASCLRLPEPTATLRHNPVPQRAHDLALHTSALALALGIPEPCTQKP